MKNIILHSLPRSGHTAVLYWLACQHDGPKHYLDKGKLANKQEHGYSYVLTQDTVSLEVAFRHARIRDSDIKLFGEFYDDPQKRMFIDDTNPLVPINHWSWNGVPDRFNRPFKHVLMIRDCWNMAASYIEVTKTKPKAQNTLSEKVEAWKHSAREALGETEFLEDRAVILYNRWVADANYRKSVCEKLELTFTDYGFKTVPDRAEGSSFDKLKFDGKADDMKTLTRYRRFIDNGIFRHYVEDREVFRLQRKLFRMYGDEGWMADYNPWWYKIGKVLRLIG